MHRIVAAGFAGVIAYGAFAQQDAHEHGVAELRVAVDGGRVVIEFASPLDNLVGFEHAPQTAAQRRALAAAEQRLRAVDTLFVTPSAAACAVTAIELESPYPQDAGPQSGAPAHREDHAAPHAELHASYELECAVPAALKEVRVGLIEAFPRIRRIRAQTATPGGQRAVVLDASRRVLPL
jgi:hypothetical protein